MDEESFSIAQLSRQTGVSTHTLRYYEGLGLLPEVERDASSGHRRYFARHVGWVRFLRRLRSAGMPIATMREYVGALEAGRQASWPKRRQLLAQHRQHVAERIEELEKHLAVLDRKLTRGCDPSLETQGD